MKSAERDIPTASRSRLGHEPARSRGEALFRTRVARRSVGDAVRRTISGPLGQDTLIASLLTTASLVGLLVHLQGETAADLLLESGHLGGQGVFADRKRGR